MNVRMVLVGALAAAAVATPSPAAADQICVWAGAQDPPVKCVHKYFYDGPVTCSFLHEPEYVVVCVPKLIG